MKISVVIPAYNGEQFLGPTVESVLAQTICDWELVIVDDGSNDNTSAIGRAYADRDDRVRLVGQTNAGVALARNRGFAETDPSSAYIVFLDHDDLWERDALSTLLEAHSNRPCSVAASGLSKIIDSQGQLCEPGKLETWGRNRVGVEGYRLVRWPQDAPTRLAVLAYDNCIYTPGQVLIRRWAFQAVRRFDSSVSPCDDWDLWLRLSQLGDIAFADRVVLSWRWHGTNGSTQKERIFALQRQVRGKLLSSPALTDDQRVLVRAANSLWGQQVCSMRLQRAVVKLLQGELSPAAILFALAIRDWIHSIRGVPVATPVLRPTIRELFRSARTGSLDISEHVDQLYHIARSCRHVTEFGTRGGVSTAAFLAAKPRVLVSYDRVRLPVIDTLEAVARTLRRTQFVFHHADALTVDIQETDLLFIDTVHVYAQLKRELTLHAEKVRKYMVFHGTATSAQEGEHPGSRGLWPAVEEFLTGNPDWLLTDRLESNNGLTVLTRRATPTHTGGRAKRSRPGWKRRKAPSGAAFAGPLPEHSTGS